MEQHSPSKYNVLQPLLLSVMVVIGMLCGYKMNDRTDFSLIEASAYTDEPAAIGRIEEIIRFVETKYVDDLDSDVLSDAALRSVVRELDPHSIYLNPEQVQQVNEQMDGSFHGVGIETFFLDDTARIVSVLDDGPAAFAGIQPFDKILAINDTLVAGQGLEFNEIREHLRGNVGDQRSIKILRARDTINLDISIASIPLKTSDIAYSIGDSIAYIKITRFSSNTYKEFMEQLDSMALKFELKHLVIDLRDNPGGYLPEATKILSQIFKEKGRLLVYTEGRHDKKQEYKSTGKRFWPIDKVAVLINEYSASGSEIIAGAIQDWDRGLLVGRRTYGKGLVQEQYSLKNGGALRLTVSRYYTPSGRSIQRDYSDKEHYSYDLEERFRHGEYYEKDSMEVVDSLLYSTKTLKRKVYGGGGVSPDEFVALDSAYLNTIYGRVSGNIPEFVFRGVSTNSKNFKSLHKEHKVPDGLWIELDRYIDSLKLDLKISDHPQFYKLWERDIVASTINILEGNIAEQKYLNESDPLFIKGLEYVQSELNLESYTKL